MILLTDGCANTGPACSAAQLVALAKERAAPVGVSAFGYGDDCDQMLLGDLALAGGGSYAYIRDEDAVLTAFARELGGLIGTYASKVRVRVVPAAGAATEESENVPDLLYYNQIPVLFQVPVPAGPVGTQVAVGTVEVSWNDDRGRRQEARTTMRIDYTVAGNETSNDDPEVSRLRDERLLRYAQERAERYAARHDFDRARRVLKNALKDIVDPALATFVREALLPCYADAESIRGSSGLRSSSKAALGRQRQVAPASEVASCFDVGPSVVESRSILSFKSGPRRKP